MRRKQPLSFYFFPLFRPNIASHLPQNSPHHKHQNFRRWPPHAFCGLFPLCGCFLVPQEAEILSPEGHKLGSVVEAHHNCVCGPSVFMDVKDAEGATRYVCKAELAQHCFGAPNCCCKEFSFEVRSLASAPPLCARLCRG